MAAGLPTLGDHNVHSGRHDPPCFLRTAHRMQHYSAGFMNALDVRGRVTPSQRNDPRPGLQQRVEPLVLIPLEHQIDTKRP
jgi:hypothetical protein